MANGLLAGMLQVGHLLPLVNRLLLQALILLCVSSPILADDSAPRYFSAKLGALVKAKARRRCGQGIGRSAAFCDEQRDTPTQR